MDKETLLNYISCPITRLIFCDPVLAEDGQIYEYMAIKNHLTKTNNSFLTGDKIGTAVVRVPLIKKMVDDFLDKNSEYRNNQFLFKKPYYLFSKEFIDLLKEKQYDKLKDFTSIMLNTDINKDTLFELICKSCPDDVIKHIIDNAIDYDTCNKKKLRPLHIACKHSTVEVITHLINKGVDLEAEDLNKERP